MQTFQLITFAALIVGLWALPMSDTPDLTACVSKLTNTEQTCQKTVFEHIDPKKVIEWGEQMTKCCMAYQLIQCMEDAIVKEPACKDAGALIKGMIELKSKEEFGKIGCTNFDKCK